MRRRWRTRWWAAPLTVAPLVATLAAPAPASAANTTQTVTASLPAQETDWTRTASIARFDPARGELVKVDVTLDATVSGSAGWENLDAVDHDVTATLSANVTVSQPGGSLVTSAAPATTAQQRLGAYDGTTDFGGASGTTVSPAAGAEQAAVSLSSPAALAAFTGTGTIALAVSATGTSVGDPSPTTTSKLVTLAAAKVTVVYAYLPDTRPPDPPTITSAPPASTNQAAPSFEFTAEPGTSTECALTGPGPGPATFTSCTSPWSPGAPLPSDGAYTFAVRATDAASNVGLAATTAFTLDRAAPGPPTMTQAPISPGRATAVTWAFAVEPGAVASCSIDSSPWAACAGSFAATFAPSDEGTHTFAVRATDSAGNVGDITTSTYVLDLTAPAPPELTPPPSPSTDPTPTWTFTLPAGASALACRVDGQAATGCDGGSYTALLTTDGEHSFEVVAADEAGNLSIPATSTYRLDRLAPAAPSVTPPASPTRLLTPTWTFSAEAGATTECRLDGASWLPCSSSFQASFGPGSDGVHTLAVRATDAAGNLGPTSSADVTVDTKPPALALTATPPATSSNDQPTWTFTAEPGATTTCAVDGAPAVPCSGSVTADLRLASDGPHSVAIRAVDPAGNATTVGHSFTLDRAAPATPSITSSPASPGSDLAPRWGIGGPADATLTCAIDGGSPEPCSGEYTATFTAVVDDGRHTFVVRATDAAGNTSAASGTYVLDTIAPSAPRLTAVPSSPDLELGPTWTFTSEAASSTACSFDGGEWTACAGSYTAKLAVGDDGTHTFAVRATDLAGNVGDASGSAYVLDTTPPGAPVIVSGPSSASRDDSPTWTFTVDPGATAACRVDDGPWAACAGSLTADLSTAADGTHALEIRALDSVGNVGPVSTSGYLLDRTAPARPAFVSTPPSIGAARAPAWTFTIEPGTTATCALDGGRGIACDGSYAPVLARDGIHTVSIVAIDAAGNESEPRTGTYELDTVPPSNPFVTGPASPGQDATPEWTIDVDAGSRAECSLDGAAYQPCGASFSAALADGVHRLQVRARDLAGNTSGVTTSSYVLDTVAPAPPTVSHSPEAGAWWWTFQVEPGATTECSVDGGPWTPCANPFAPPAEGEARVDVRAVDAAGNRSAPLRVVASAPPEAPPAAPPGGRMATLTPSGLDLPPPDLADGALRAATTASSAVERASPAAPPAAGGEPLAAPARRVRPEADSPPAAVAQLIQTAVKRSTLPIVVVLLVVVFVALQDRVDRRDPKLAAAPLRDEPEYLEFS